MLYPTSDVDYVGLMGAVLGSCEGSRSRVGRRLLTPSQATIVVSADLLLAMGPRSEPFDFDVLRRLRPGASNTTLGAVLHYWRECKLCKPVSNPAVYAWVLTPKGVDAGAFARRRHVTSVQGVLFA